jgi:hypothetical protein
VEVFGRRAAEVFNVWHVARYIDAIAEAARAVYDVPLYVNVWLNENGFRDAGYDYPSGGAVSDIIPLWKAAAPHVDILAPDIYLPDSDSFRQICAAYSRADNPLLIPSAACDRRRRAKCFTLSPSIRPSVSPHSASTASSTRMA